MTGNFQKFRAWLIDHPVLAEGASIAGLFFYCLELWRYTHLQYSVLDEGLYLYTGWSFTAGKYVPFQAYGPWTNQMPLAFLIPGWVQLFLGPGLQTGRSVAFILGGVALLGLWLTARRLGGRWIAAGLVAAVALNPAAARMVSMAASQGLVACLLAWTMFFSLGAEPAQRPQGVSKSRKNGQLALAGLLAGTAVMVRINLLPLLPLLFLYVLWAYGWKSALWTLAGELLVFGGLHLLYWPNILQLWARLLPLSLLKGWGPPANIPTWHPDNPPGFRVASFFLAFRYHFAALVGALAAWLFWPKEWKSNAHFKTAIFLSVLLLAFFLLHAWAALGNEYCVFCFSTYTSFYSSVGLMLVAVTLPGWRWELSAGRKWLGALGMLGLLVGMAYSAEGTVAGLLGNNFYKGLLSLPIPGFSGAQLWQIVANKFRVEYGGIYDAFHTWFPVLLAAAFGLSLLAAQQMFNRRKNSAALNPGRERSVERAVWIFVLLGTFFSPSTLLAGEYNSYDCQNNVLPGYEAVGAQLAKVIPAGSSVYWDGYSPISLLYLPGIKIYPAQLHGAYSFRISDDEDALMKYGWWNQRLAEKWLAEADFVLVEERNISRNARNDWMTQALENYQEVAVTGLQAACQPSSFFHVYRRK